MGNVKNKCPTFIQSGQFQRRAEIDVNGKPTRTGEVQTNGKKFNFILDFLEGLFNERVLLCYNANEYTTCGSHAGMATVLHAIQIFLAFQTRLSILFSPSD